MRESKSANINFLLLSCLASVVIRCIVPFSPLSFALSHQLSYGHVHSINKRAASGISLYFVSLFAHAPYKCGRQPLSPPVVSMKKDAYCVCVCGKELCLA